MLHFVKVHISHIMVRTRWHEGVLIKVGCVEVISMQLQLPIHVLYTVHTLVHNKAVTSICTPLYKVLSLPYSG